MTDTVNQCTSSCRGQRSEVTDHHSINYFVPTSGRYRCVLKNNCQHFRRGHHTPHLYHYSTCTDTLYTHRCMHSQGKSNNLSSSSSSALVTCVRIELASMESVIHESILIFLSVLASDKPVLTAATRLWSD